MVSELERRQSVRTRQVWSTAALVALFLFCCMTRLLDLGWKTIMHDEALFVYYTEFQLYRAWNYVYLPILHGPAMLQLQAMVFQIFGSSTFTMRLGCALLGIAGFLWIYKLKPWLGPAGTWIALVFYTLSPGITYYQRFFRNDALYMFNALWIVVSLAYWWHSRKPKWLVSGLAACAVLFTNKESSLFVYFSIFTFFVMLVLYDLCAWVLRGKNMERLDPAERAPAFPNPVWPTLLLGGFVVLVITQVFEGLTYVVDGDEGVIRAIGHDWVLKDVRSIPLAFGWVDDAGATGVNSGHFWRLFYVGMFLALLIGFWAVRFCVRHRIGEREFLRSFWALFYKSRWHAVAAAGLASFIYLWVFTTGFHHPTGFFEIYEKTWAYWGGQHEWGRIGGPFHQHLLNMLIYELPAVLIVTLAWVLGLFRLRPARVLGISFVLILLALAVFNRLLFHHTGTFLPGGNPVPLNVPYLHSLIIGAAIIAVALLAFPLAGRTLLPAAFFGTLIYSIVYMNSADWNGALKTRLYDGTEPLRLANRQVDLAQFMEIQFNFDGGSSLAIVVLLIFFATLYTWYELSRGRRFRAFLIWWTVTATGSACYAREAVPQVGIHAMLPLLLLASSYINDLYLAAKTKGGRAWIVAMLAVMAAWNLKATMNLNFYYADDPRERMVYGPAPHDIANHCQFVLDYARIAPNRVDAKGVPLWITQNNDPTKVKEVRIGVCNDVVVWPVRWYLRNLDWRESKNPQEFINQNYEFLFVKESDVNSTPDIKAKYNTYLASGIRFYQPGRFSASQLLDIWKMLIPGQYLDGTAQAGEAYNANQEWKKIWRYLMLRETFDGGRPGSGNISGTQYVFCVRKDLY